jgi:hypothetical protein
MAGHPVPWLEEILRTAGDISPGTASQVQHAAGYAHRAGTQAWGQAWGQYAARQAAKAALAGAAAESDPAVQTALQASTEAREHAARLLADAAGPDGRADPGTPEGLAIYLANHAASALHEEYSQAYGAAYRRYYAEVNQAWRTADTDFVRSHRAALEAADPEGLKDILARLTEDSPPAAGRAPAPQPTGPAGTRASGAQGTANSSDNTKDAGDPRVLSSLDFPAPVLPGTRALPAEPPRATGQARRPATRRAL